MKNINKTINYDTQLYAVSQVISFIDEGKIVLNSGIWGRLWSVEKKRLYVENFLIALPQYPIILDSSLKNYKTGRYDFWIVVDGYNRLCALNDFFKGKLYIEEHRFYQDLSSYEQSLIEDKELIFYILSPETPIYLRYEFFERMNPAERQKIRNIINQGRPFDLLKEFKQHFTQCFKIDNLDRLNTGELILTCIAFSFFKYDHNQKISTFLDESMNEIRKLEESKIEEVKQSFIKVLENIASKGLVSKFYENEINKKVFLKNVFLYYLFSHFQNFENDLSIFKLDKEEENRLKLIQKL